MDDWRARHSLLALLMQTGGGGWQNARPVLPWVEDPPYPVPPYAQQDPIIGDREDRAREYLRKEDELRKFQERLQMGDFERRADAAPAPAPPGLPRIA